MIFKFFFWRYLTSKKFTCCLGIYKHCVLVNMIFNNFFLEILILMNSCFRHRPVHVLLILRMGRIRWNSSKCRVMYCIGYHVRISFIGLWWLFLWLLILLSFLFILVCICIATVTCIKRRSWQYMCVNSCTFVYVHPWVPSERCEINRNIDRVLYTVFETRRFCGQFF